jgi:hypothetical protein
MWFAGSGSVVSQDTEAPNFISQFFDRTPTRTRLGTALLRTTTQRQHRTTALRALLGEKRERCAASCRADNARTVDHPRAPGPSRSSDRPAAPIR